MEPAFTIQSLGEDRGRGVVASRDAPKGSVLFVVAPDVATLYSPFARTLCARCFAEPRLDSACGSPYVCPTCDQFTLCARCHTEVTRSTANTTCATEGQEAPSLMAIHRVACAWFNELPADVRAPERDTDYLRFCLFYGACRALGDVSLRDRLMQLESNATSQSSDELQFWEIFARDRIVATFSGPAPPSQASFHTSVPRYSVPWQELLDVVLRTRCNSLGFPFTAEATTGWSLEHRVCMLNHNCEPNVAVVMAENDDDCVRAVGGNHEPSNDARDSLAGKIGIKAVRDLRAGEELCISYVDSEDYDGDVAARTRHLLEQYHFVCRCDKCTRQRVALKKKK